MARDFSRFFENEVIRDSVITAIVLFLWTQKTNKSQWQYFVIVKKAPAFHASLLRPAETERDRCKFWSSVLKRLKVPFFFYFFNYLVTTCECFCIEISSTKRTTKKTPPITQKRISTETFARESLAKLSKVKKITRLFAKWLSDQLSYSFIQIWA